MEDYCHAFEHTVELQVIFLQHMLGPGVKILPILCGCFAHSIYRRRHAGRRRQVSRFFETLGELREREGDRLFWVLGVDMAHMGARYQRSVSRPCEQGVMQKWRRATAADRADQIGRCGRILESGAGESATI